MLLVLGSNLGGARVGAEVVVALRQPEAALPAAFLAFSFVGTGGSFLAFAAIAAKRGLDTQARGRKSIYYLGGLTEGTETVLFLSLACLLPEKFTLLALVFGSLCWLTTLGRVLAGYQLLREPGDDAA